VNEPKTRFYNVPREKHEGWARIWISDDGCFTTISDFGNYGYWWGSPGCEFREFLCGCDESYLMGKLGMGRREWDEEATKKSIERELKRLHDDGGEDTREELALLAEADLSSEAGFVRWVDASGDSGERLSRLMDSVYCGELAQYQPPVQLQMFVKHIWPRFVAQLRAEIATEAA
jgi:hypothetical protein